MAMPRCQAVRRHCRALCDERTAVARATAAVVVCNAKRFGALWRRCHAAFCMVADGPPLTVRWCHYLCSRTVGNGDALRAIAAAPLARWLCICLQVSCGWRSEHAVSHGDARDANATLDLADRTLLANGTRRIEGRSLCLGPGCGSEGAALEGGGGLTLSFFVDAARRRRA